MVTFRNNNNGIRRNNFRRNDRNFKTNGDRPKFGSNYSNNENFKRKIPGRNNHNASKLIEKYSDLAREASSSGDKILSENYLQHADHFTRVMNDQEAFKKERFTENKLIKNENSFKEKSSIVSEISKNEPTKDVVVNKVEVVKETKKIVKSQTN